MEALTDMQNQTSEHSTVRMTPADHIQLSVLSAGANALGGEILREELDRAMLVAGDDPHPRFVRLHTPVEYVDLLSGRTRTLEVTLPAEADIDRQRISVLSPVGAALIGLAAGDSYAWTGDDGRRHALVVVTVGSEHEDA